MLPDSTQVWDLLAVLCVYPMQPQIDFKVWQHELFKWCQMLYWQSIVWNCINSNLQCFSWSYCWDTQRTWNVMKLDYTLTLQKLILNILGGLYKTPLKGQKASNKGVHRISSATHGKKTDFYVWARQTASLMCIVIIFMTNADLRSKFTFLGQTVTTRSTESTVRWGFFAPHFHKAGIVHWLYYHHIVNAAFSLSTKHESLFYVNVLHSMAVQYCKQEWNGTWAEAIFYIWAVLSFLIK